MRINWIGYQFREYDGYGRFSNRMIQALMRMGVEVQPLITEIAFAPAFIQRLMWADWDNLTISCVPAYFGRSLPGRHWLYSMTEGSELPEDWPEMIALANPERIIVPCEYNAEAFVRGTRQLGLNIPVHVVNGGTDPGEFQIHKRKRDGVYTFLSLADRGSRKGWTEVYQAFYAQFGSPKDTADVRLILKARPKSNEMLERIGKADNPDPRVDIWIEDMQYVGDVFERADCVVIPSRSEGFGMPHREAAMMGKPVISHRYAGLDDGHTHKWSWPVENGTMDKIPKMFQHIAGKWRKPSVSELGQKMRYAYEHRDEMVDRGVAAADWLADNQTWEHSARGLLDLVERYS